MDDLEEAIQLESAVGGTVASEVRHMQCTRAADPQSPLVRIGCYPYTRQTAAGPCNIGCTVEGGSRDKGVIYLHLKYIILLFNYSKSSSLILIPF